MNTQKEVIRDSISDLLMENDIDLSNDISDDTLTFQKSQTINYYDGGGALIKAKDKAEKVMNTLLKLYMSDGFISKSEYIQAKVNLDSMTLGKIICLGKSILNDVRNGWQDALGYLKMMEEFA